MQIGTTVDDAIGEAYDKVARMLGCELTPCGGPALERLAATGNPAAHDFTVPLRDKRTCDFSFSGLKTAVRRAVEREGLASETLGGWGCGGGAMRRRRQRRVQISPRRSNASRWRSSRSACDAAVEWARESAPELSCLVVSGGVAANKAVRASLDAVADAAQLPTRYPSLALCTDNGAPLPGVRNVQCCSATLHTAMRCVAQLPTVAHVAATCSSYDRSIKR